MKGGLAPRALVTDADGQVVLTDGCRQAATVTAQPTVRAMGTATPVSNQATFECIDPATLTTTTTSTTAP